MYPLEVGIVIGQWKGMQVPVWWGRRATEHREHGCGPCTAVVELFHMKGSRLDKRGFQRDWVLMVEEGITLTGATRPQNTGVGCAWSTLWGPPRPPGGAH